jgi:hypothetical protein
LKPPTLSPEIVTVVPVGVVLVKAVADVPLNSAMEAMGALAQPGSAPVTQLSVRAAYVRGASNPGGPKTDAPEYVALPEFDACPKAGRQNTATAKNLIIIIALRSNRNLVLRKPPRCPYTTQRVV